MGILSFLGGSSIEGALTGVTNLLDDVITNDEERATVERLLEEVRQKPHLAQVHLNAQEANHRSIFVAGWRPFCGWVCGFALAYAFILLPFFTFLAAMAGATAATIALIPIVDITTMLPILLGMLGLGAMRSSDKNNGTTQN